MDFSAVVIRPFVNIRFKICYSVFQYLDVARTLKYYGFLQFRPCLCDYPRQGTRVLVSIGNRELNLRVRLAEGQEIREGSFKVTRMRCWRITTLYNVSKG
jgi:sorting nexin-17